MILAVLAVMAIMAMVMCGRVLALIMSGILLATWVLVHIVKEIEIKDGRIKITYYR